jgi:hypothetical protein
MEKKYEIKIKKIFEETIPLFIRDEDGISMYDIEEMGDLIRLQLRNLYIGKKLKNEVLFYCTFFKWIDEDGKTLSDQEVESWKEAEELRIEFIMEKETNRRNNREEKFIEECLIMVKDDIDMRDFMDVCLNVKLDECKDTNGETFYNYIGTLSLTKPNFNTNHPNHAYQGSC